MLEKVVDRATDLWARREKDGVLLNDTAPVLYELNETACLIWEQIDGKKTVREIVQIIISKYPDTTVEEVTQDVISFIEQLISNGLAKDCRRKNETEAL